MCFSFDAEWRMALLTLDESARLEMHRSALIGVSEWSKNRRGYVSGRGMSGFQESILEFGI